MKRILCVTVLASILLASAALAQDRPRERAGEGGPRPEGAAGRANPAPRAGGDVLRNLAERLTRELQLTADQQAQIKQIVDTHRQEVENVLKAGGEGVRAKVQGLRKKLLDDIVAALTTPEQKAKFERIRQNILEGPRPLANLVERVKAALAKLDLTPEQKTAVDKVVADAIASSAAAEGDAKEAVWRQAIQDLKTRVLTPEQTKKFEELMRAPAPGGVDAYGALRIFEELNLAEEQRGQIRKIMAEYGPKLKDAQPEQRRAIMREATAKIEKDVLTDAQREQLKKLREERREDRRAEGGVRPNLRGAGNPRRAAR